MNDGDHPEAKEKKSSLIDRVGRKLFDNENNVSKIPPWIETYHLTFLTILWSLLVLLFSYLATYNLNWLWGSSIAVFLQYITDTFDGSLGRYRNTGLIKWGFFMDHFLDYIFLCSIMIGYSFIAPPKYDVYLFFLFAILGGFMTCMYLAFSMTRDFRYEYEGIGPTELRLAVIIANTMLIFIGRILFIAFLPYIMAFFLIALIYVVYKNHKIIWKMDMDNKKQKFKKKKQKNS